MDHLYYMKEAFDEATKALSIEEVPIGCIIVKDNEIIGRGYNRRNLDNTVLGHAEITAIAMACSHVGDWRLEGCTVYVTVEPCPMCAGAIVQSRADRLVYGAANKKAGCCGSILNLMNQEGFNHVVETIPGVMEKECAALMSGFFKRLRSSTNGDLPPRTCFKTHK